MDQQPQTRRAGPAAPAKGGGQQQLLGVARVAHANNLAEHLDSIWDGSDCSSSHLQVRQALANLFEESQFFQANLSDEQRLSYLVRYAWRGWVREYDQRKRGFIDSHKEIVYAGGVRTKLRLLSVPLCYVLIFCFFFSNVSGLLLVCYTASLVPS